MLIYDLHKFPVWGKSGRTLVALKSTFVFCEEVTTSLSPWGQPSLQSMFPQSVPTCNRSYSILVDRRRPGGYHMTEEGEEDINPFPFQVEVVDPCRGDVLETATGTGSARVSETWVPSFYPSCRRGWRPATPCTGGYPTQDPFRPLLEIGGCIHCGAIPIRLKEAINNQLAHLLAVPDSSLQIDRLI